MSNRKKKSDSQGLEQESSVTATGSVDASSANASVHPEATENSPSEPMSKLDEQPPGAHRDESPTTPEGSSDEARSDEECHEAVSAQAETEASSEPRSEGQDPHGHDWDDEEVETVYEQTADGHRITRRATRRRTSRIKTSKEFEEEVTEVTAGSLPTTEVLPPTPYQAPRNAAHPAPVG